MACGLGAEPVSELARPGTKCGFGVVKSKAESIPESLTLNGGRHDEEGTPLLEQVGMEAPLLGWPSQDHEAQPCRQCCARDGSETESPSDIRRRNEMGNFAHWATNWERYSLMSQA